MPKCMPSYEPESVQPVKGVGWDDREQLTVDHLLSSVKSTVGAPPGLQAVCLVSNLLLGVRTREMLVQAHGPTAKVSFLPAGSQAPPRGQHCLPGE